MRQADLAEEVGVSRSHLTKIERGHDLPGRETIVAIANVFNVSLDWLAEGKGDPRPAQATSEEEALLLFAFRQLPANEREAHLRLLLARVRKHDA